MIPSRDQTETISISIPSDLLLDIDIYCERYDYTRSKFISRAVRKYLLQKLDSPALWAFIHQQRDESSQ